MRTIFEAVHPPRRASFPRQPSTSHDRAQDARARRTRGLARALLALVVATCALGSIGPTRADDGFRFVDGEFGINVYGLSYHLDRERAREIGTVNEINPGLGLRYRFAEWKRWSFFADAGVFDDSGRNTAKIIGAGAVWDFGKGFRAGAGLVLFSSDTYNLGRPFVAPIPLVSYDAGPVTLNLSFSPKLMPFNEIPTLGFWITFWPKRW